MKRYYSDSIIPYEGIDSFRFGQSIESIRKELKDKKISFNLSVDPHKGCTPEIPWIFIEIGKSITLCFVKEILFEIVLENDFEGKLPNGIKIGMNMDEANRIDNTLQYNDDDEDFISEMGYWIEDDLNTNKVISITVYVKEADDNDSFFKYEWINRYTK